MSIFNLLYAVFRGFVLEMFAYLIRYCLIKKYISEILKTNWGSLYDISLFHLYPTDFSTFKMVLYMLKFLVVITFRLPFCHYLTLTYNI